MDLNLLALSIGIGLVVSLLFSELFGLAAGGLVVPGYIALYLTRPLDIAMTLAAALFTFFLVRIVASFVIIYGRRRTAVMILVGYAVGMLLETAMGAAVEGGGSPLFGADSVTALAARSEAIDVGVIGYIVPGLIAIWLDRQGVLPTLAALVTSAVVVRLILILAVPNELQWFEASPDSFLEDEEVISR